jgi:hypothetical protein
MRETVGSVPSDATVFGFPAGTKWFVFGGAALFSVLAVALPALVMPTGRFSLGAASLWFVVSGSLAAASWLSFARLRARIALNETGIWYLPPSGSYTFLAWKDVSRVRADDTGQRLVLTDTSKHREIKIEYQVEHFSTVRDFVLAHSAAQIHECASNLTCFHRTWINKAILAVFGSPFLIASWMSYKQGERGMPLFVPLCVCIVAGVGIALDPLRVSITSDAVVIAYPGWKRTIPFGSITNIAIEDVRSRGNVWAAVVIERKKNRPIRLFRFREGSLALHDALRTAWTNAGQRQAPA